MGPGLPFFVILLPGLQGLGNLNCVVISTPTHGFFVVIRKMQVEFVVLFLWNEEILTLSA